MEDKTHRLIRYLNDTYATEMGGAAALDDLFRRTSDPDVRAVVAEHLVETKSQAARLLERLRALGGSEADAKVAFQTLAAKGSKLINLFHDQEDKQTQDLVKTYALEHFEIGVYLSLAAYARAIGDEETARLADTIGAEERAAAERMEALIPQVSVQAIRRTAEAAEAAQAVEAAQKPDKKSAKKQAKKNKDQRQRSGSPEETAGRRPVLSVPIVAGGAALGLGVGAALATIAMRRSSHGGEGSTSTSTGSSSGGLTDDTVARGDQVVTEVIVVETVAPGIADTSVSAEDSGMAADTDIVTDSAVTGEGGISSSGAAYEPPATGFAAHSSEGTGTLPTASSNFGGGLSAHEDVAVPATGHDQPEDIHDPLGPAHNLPPDEASAVRAAERRDRGRVTSPERDTMFDEPQGAGESGSMSNPTALGDRNNVGRNG